MGTLYIIATPIGNLEDITKRGINTLKKVDGVLCEDTTRTVKILNKLKIKKPLESFHQHSSEKKLNNTIAKLKQGETLAFLTDSGTPGVSDPGPRLVKECHENKILVVAIPGASAVTTAISASGFPAQQFLFLGFVPKKEKEKKKFLKKVRDSSYTTCFFESPHRILKTLGFLEETLKEDRKIFIGRELTKKYESFYRGEVKKVIDQVKSDPQKGEFTILVEKKNKENSASFE